MLGLEKVIKEMAKLKSQLPALVGQKATRENRRITNKEIADAIGVSESTMSRWMRGEIDSMTMARATLLCAYLECDLGDLAFIEHEVA